MEEQTKEQQEINNQIINNALMIKNIFDITYNNYNKSRCFLSFMISDKGFIHLLTTHSRESFELDKNPSVEIKEGDSPQVETINPIAN